MGFKIPSARLNGRTATAQDFRLAFGGKNKLPQDNTVSLHASIGGVKLILLPPHAPVMNTGYYGLRKTKSSKHRVFCICPVCHKDVPAGRTMQHKCKPIPVEFELIWAPEGKPIGRVFALSTSAAIRKAPQPYRKYLGEIRAEQVALQGL